MHKKMKTFKRSCKFEGIYIFHLFNKVFLFGTLLFIFRSTIEWNYNEHENSEFSEVMRYKRNLSYSTEGIHLYNEGYFHGGDAKLENNNISSEFGINIFPEYYDIDNIEYAYDIKNKQVLKNIDTNYGDIQRITNLDSLKTNSYNKNNNNGTKIHDSKILYGFQKEKQSELKPIIEDKKVLSDNKIKLNNKKVNGDISMHKEVKFINKVDDIYNFDEYIKLYPNPDMNRVLNKSTFQRKDGMTILPKIKHDYTDQKNVSIETIPQIVEKRENKKEETNDKLKNIPRSDHGLNKLNTNKKKKEKGIHNKTIISNLNQIKNGFDLINSLTKKRPKNKNKPTANVKILDQKKLKNKAQIAIREKLKEKVKPKEQELKEKIKIQEKKKEKEKGKGKVKKQPFYRVILDKIKKKIESNYIRGIANAFIILIFSYFIVMLLILYFILNAIRPKIYNNTVSHRGSRL
ncbi:hypothetical protein YYC_02201 [Plasmodium yoelii 17X]|uniref:Uncharacterized protein n=2 Tax=Plasmodium yoelii 17X TaxID=1323249 RepID=V7PMA9_PLAYE|nr:hypothetical protein YYC_02201 [Plasmodium yoelii 17X]